MTLITPWYWPLKVRVFPSVHVSVGHAAVIVCFLEFGPESDRFRIIRDSPLKVLHARSGKATTVIKFSVLGVLLDQLRVIFNC